MNYPEIHQRIIDLEGEIAAAEAAHAITTKAFTAAPTNQDARDDRRRTEAVLSNLRSERSELANELAALEAEAKSEASVARRAAAVADLYEAEALLAKRQEAAEEIDKALANLVASVDRWSALNAKAAGVVGEYYKKAVPNVTRRSAHTFCLGSNLLNVPVNVIACQVAEAVKDLNTSSTMALRYVRGHPDMPELAAVEVARQNAGIASQMRIIAELEGLPL